MRITSNNKNSAMSKLVDHPDIRTDNNVRLINVTMEYGLPVCREEWHLSNVDLTTDQLRYVFDYELLVSGHFMRVMPLHRQHELETIRGNFVCWKKHQSGVHQLHYKPSEKSGSQIAVTGTNELPVLKRCSGRSRESKGGIHTSLSIPSASMHISPTTQSIPSLVSPRNVNPRNLRQTPRGSDTNNQPKCRVSNGEKMPLPPSAPIR